MKSLVCGAVLAFVMLTAQVAATACEDLTKYTDPLGIEYLVSADQLAYASEINRVPAQALISIKQLSARELFQSNPKAASWLGILGDYCFSKSRSSSAFEDAQILFARAVEVEQLKARPDATFISAMRLKQSAASRALQLQQAPASLAAHLRTITTVPPASSGVRANAVKPVILH